MKTIVLTVFLLTAISSLIFGMGNKPPEEKKPNFTGNWIPAGGTKTKPIPEPQLSEEEKLQKVNEDAEHFLKYFNSTDKYDNVDVPLVDYFYSAVSKERNRLYNKSIFLDKIDTPEFIKYLEDELKKEIEFSKTHPRAEGTFDRDLLYIPLGYYKKESSMPIMLETYKTAIIVRVSSARLDDAVVNYGNEIIDGLISLTKNKDKDILLNIRKKNRFSFGSMLRNSVELTSENRDKIKNEALILLKYKDTAEKNYTTAREYGVELLKALKDPDTIPILEEIAKTDPFYKGYYTKVPYDDVPEEQRRYSVRDAANRALAEITGDNKYIEHLKKRNKRVLHSAPSVTPEKE